MAVSMVEIALPEGCKIVVTVEGIYAAFAQLESMVPLEEK